MREVAELRGRFDTFETKMEARHTENLEEIRETRRETSSNRRWIIAQTLTSLGLLLGIATLVVTILQYH